MQVETIRANVIGCLNLADVCLSKDIHMTYYGTGCIFHYDDAFPQDSGKGFKESDKPNFTGSYYSHSKVSNLCDKWSKIFSNGLAILRSAIPGGAAISQICRCITLSVAVVVRPNDVACTYCCAK